MSKQNAFQWVNSKRSKFLLYATKPFDSNLFYRYRKYHIIRVMVQI